MTNKLAAVLVATALLLESPIMLAHAATIVTPSTASVADQNPSSGVWIVEPQDTLWNIAASVQVPLAQIESVNPAVNAGNLQVGDVIVIPSVWTVKAGDSLWKIAQTNHVSLQSLEGANPGVNPTNLQVGSTLVLPAPAQALRANDWLVTPGDTLWKVAQITGASIWALAQANHLTNVNDIHTGENLVIPLDTSASAAPSQLPATISLVTAAYPLQLFANGDSSTETLQLQVKDAAGNPVPNVQVALASSDRSVAYLQYSSRYNASAQQSFSALTTDSNGMINVLATTSQQTGSTVLFVAADGATLSIPMTVVPIASQFIVSTPNLLFHLGDATPQSVQVTVKDRFGNPVAGIPLHLSVMSPALVNLPANATIYTNAQGQAQFDVTVGTAVGSTWIVMSDTALALDSGAVNVQVVAANTSPS